MTPSLLSSSRIRLRAVEPSDTLMMYEVENDPDVWFYSSRVAPLSMSAISRYARETGNDPFSEKQLRLIIELDDETPCGIVDLYEINSIDRTAMVGIVVIDKFRQQRIASEALVLLEGYASKVLHLRMLGARIADINHASIALFKGAGYNVAGTIPGWIISPDGPTGMVIVYRDLQKTDVR